MIRFVSIILDHFRKESGRGGEGYTSGLLAADFVRA